MCILKSDQRQIKAIVKFLSMYLITFLTVFPERLSNFICENAFYAKSFTDSSGAIPPPRKTVTYLCISHINELVISIKPSGYLFVYFFMKREMKKLKANPQKTELTIVRTKFRNLECVSRYKNGKDSKSSKNFQIKYFEVPE